MAGIQVSRRLNRRQRRRVLVPSAFLFVGVFFTVLVGLSHYNLHSLQRHLRYSSSAHFSRQRSLRPQDDDLTILSFGGDSYIELLADKIVSDDYLDLAVACTQSLVGNSVEFDAITVALEDRTNWSSRNRILVDRIRKRFPTAVIVLVELPEDPLNALTIYPTSEHFSEWRRRKFGSDFVANNSEIAYAMMQDAKALKGSWINPFVNDDKRLMERIRSDSLLVTYRLDPSLASVADAADFLNLFATPDGTLSVSGMRKVADDIRNVVRATLDRTVKVRKDRSVQSQIKSWGTGDDCHLWLVSGDYLPSSAVPVVLPQGANWHKHALEFRKSYGDAITIHNPFHTERMLFLTYLTDAHNMEYSNTRVFVNGVPTVEIQPFHDEPAKDTLFTRSSGVGLVPPGTSTVVLEPVTAGLPFHLIGASILAQEAMEITDVTEFELERENLLKTHTDMVKSNLHRLFRH